MSAGNQNKKSGSSTNSSMVNTPANTPVSNMANGQNTTQNSPPPNNAPKFGTLVPNRIFVGGISANTTESELLQLFSNYGTVKAAKIIQDRAGVSKGYGFITFESEDDAKKLQREADNIVLRERKLNIAPAIKKQPFSRAFDASSPPVAPGNPAPYFFPPGAMPYFQGGVAYYPQPPTGPADPTVQQPPVYQPPSVYSQQSAAPQPAAYPPVMFPTQHLYMPQQYPLPMPYEYSYYPNGGSPQYMVGGQGGSQPQIPPLQRPNSPPRQNCFGQLPYTNSNDTMYYNMPIYGPIDGTIYPEPIMEIPHNPMPEDAYYIQDTTPSAGKTQLTHVNQVDYHQVDHNDISAVQVKTMDSSQNDVNGRHSSTPVISLLSLDQHQDRDLLSMQSGRREKSTSAPPISHNSHYSYNNNCSSQNYSGIPTAPPHYGGNNCYGYNNIAHQMKNPKSNSITANGYNRNNNTRKWQNNDRRSVETSSMSSLRTDSNSSASIVDENKNEEKVLTNNNNKTSHNYETHHTIQNFNKLYNTRNIVSATVRPTRGAGFEKRNSSNPRFSNTHNSVNPNNRNYNFGRQKEANRCFQNVPTTYNKPPISPFYQMQANSHFMPPARNRNNRRTMRRNGHGPLVVNEIGAGDAPLPNAEVPEICNKFDTLKLA